MIRDSSGNGSKKFASISAKIKAKQLARAALLTQKQPVEGEPDKPVHDLESSVQSTPELNSTQVWSTVGPGAEPSEPVPTGVELEAVDEAEVEEEGGDEQIYYMLVDDGSQLENQTILIDESQLSRAGGHHGFLQVQISYTGFTSCTSPGSNIIHGGEGG